MKVYLIFKTLDKYFYVLLFFMSFSMTLVGQNLNEPKCFRGKITLGMEPNYDFPNFYFYVYDNYVLEKITKIVTSTDLSKSKQDKTTVDGVKKEEVPTDYILTDFNTRNCFEFSLSESSPKVHTVFALKNKVKGKKFRDEPNFNIEPNDLALFVFEKDTIISGKKYKLLKSRDVIDVGPGVKSKITFYLDSELKIPFHPFSKYLDEKFQGVIVRRDDLYNAGNTISFKCEFKDGVQEIEFIQKYISLAKQYGEVKKKEK